MANEAPRDRAATPSFSWTTVRRRNRRLDSSSSRPRASEVCFDLISSVLDVARSPEERVEARVGVTLAVLAIADGHAPVPYDGDPKSERRLATLLWPWTDEKVD